MIFSVDFRNSMSTDMENGKPPRKSPGTSITGVANTLSNSSSRKSPRTSSNNSPSASATNANVERVLRQRLLLVLCHRLGLPLLYCLHGKDPKDLKYLRQEKQELDVKLEEKWNGLFAETVTEWKAGSRVEELQPA